MGVAEDLLLQAQHLLSYQGAAPDQAALRRSVSTAYYAVFHLLTQDAAQRWSGSPEAETGLERAYNHGAMRNASMQFKGSHWVDWRGVNQPVPVKLQRVAQAFLTLQEDRHIADYNNYEIWTATDATELLNTALAAFRDWKAIREEPMASNYLLAMLVGKQR